MAFKTDSSDREAMSEINVTPLVDVMLVLLVVFIVTAPLLTQAVRVNLPKTEKTEKTDPAPDKHLATIAIDAQGGITLNEQPQPLEGLEVQLRGLLQADPELTVQFQADAAVPYGEVAKAMAVAHRAGVAKLAFITRE
jgi:biopolymer transport protein ExbD